MSMAEFPCLKIKVFKIYFAILITTIIICVLRIHVFSNTHNTKSSFTSVSSKVSIDIQEPTLSLNKFNRKLLLKCYEQSLDSKIEQHGNFWVLYNYIPAKRVHHCHESVTFTTQGDYLFLDNLITIVKRWKGPVSVALHAPGTDFLPTLNSIAFLRQCETDLIKEFVTFHLVIDAAHLPNISSTGIPLTKQYKDSFDCSENPPYTNITHKKLYKASFNLSYPINVARNVAKRASQTHFVLAADIELYPSLNLIEDFLQMISQKHDFIKSQQLVIYALPVFEVVQTESPPENKSKLIEMFKTKKAFSFHKTICNRCHAIPNLTQWLNLNISQGLEVFTTTKRIGKQVRWEAVYIGTRDDPEFDERLDWERHGNKMAQAYTLCLMDYNYLILSNAFLVHKPGIKKKMVNQELIPKTDKYIKRILAKELNTLLGSRKGCTA